MKKTLIIISLFIFNTFSFAQSINVPNELKINEGNKELNKITRNGFSISMAGDEKEIIKAFEKYLEDDQKYDVKSMFKKISAENILVPAFSEKHFNLNAEVIESGSEMVLWYWISFGPENFVSSTTAPDEAKKCKDLLKEFAKKYYTSFVMDDLSESQELVETSQDELEDITKNINGLAKDQIKENKAKDKLQTKKLKLEGKLTELNQEIQSNQIEIEKQEEEIGKLTTLISKKGDTKAEIETKIAQQENTVKELNEMLKRISKF